MKKQHASRRQFLITSSLYVGALYLAKHAVERSNALPVSQNQPPRKSGLSEVFLTAGYSPVNVAGQKARLFNYNSQIPGPVIEVQAGDTVRVHLTNYLTEPTNLHFHGLHISPNGKADNMFLEVPPRERFTYEFVLPQNHPAGTFWYHPHVHGLTAKQIFGGLSGLFLVRGALDLIPEIRAAQEVFLALKDFEIDPNGQMIAPNPMELMMQGREGSLISVNGMVNPTVPISEGGLLRLRLLNASSSRFYRLAIQDHPLYLIATDGGAVAEPIELREVLLAPGERAEVLVRGERPPGQYRLLNLPYSRGGMGMMQGGMMNGMMNGGMMGQPRNRSSMETRESANTLATLTYRGKINRLPLPQQLIPIEALPAPQTLRHFTLNAHMAFTINNQAFNPNRVDTQVRLNTVEDWEITNPGTMMAMDHPFHLHTNAFQIVSRNGKPESFLAWKDTIVVPSGEVVRIRIPFKDFSGKTLYHCHIADHGDRGMMGVIEMQA